VYGVITPASYPVARLSALPLGWNGGGFTPALAASPAPGTGFTECLPLAVYLTTIPSPSALGCSGALYHRVCERRALGMAVGCGDGCMCPPWSQFYMAC
jgi:hypothetical protein